MALEEQREKQEAAIKLADKAKKKELEAIRIIDEEERAVREANEIRKKMEEEVEVFYGAPDDVAWTDKSHAQRAADENEGEEVDKTVCLLYFVFFCASRHSKKYFTASSANAWRGWEKVE